MKLSTLNWFVNSELGINPSKLTKSPVRLFKWFKDFLKFKKLFPKNIKVVFMPSIHDKFEQSGSIDNEYFWQDLICSQHIYKRFEKHKHTLYDVGSRIDGFVSSVSSFTVCNVFDIREQQSEYENINFIKLDITEDLPIDLYKSAETLSCLHTLEHIGLGRYGDDIDPNSWKKALKNMSLIISDKENSEFILSTLCGEPVYYYNSHKIFELQELLDELKKNNLKIDKVATNNRKKKSNFMDWNQSVQKHINDSEYCLVIFILKRI